MHHHNLESWRHDHVFGQDTQHTGEIRTGIVVALTAVMMVWETLAGWHYGSMALLADGLHMGSHAVALGIAVFAYRYGRRYAGDPRFSFGTGKVNALAGFTGAILLIGFAFYMVVESAERFVHPVAITFNGAIFVAVVGFFANGLSAWILGDDHHHGHEHHEHHERGAHGAHGAAAPGHDHAHKDEDHNRRAAYLHVLADAVTSLLAVFALLCGKYFGWGWMDPAMGIVGAVLVTHWAWGLLGDTAAVLLDRQNQDLEKAVRSSVEDDDARVCDLHLWSIGNNIHAAIVSIVADHPGDPATYRQRIQSECPSLVHITVEPLACPHHGTY